MDAKPVDDPPYSMEKYDEGALLPEQQIKINELKVQIDLFLDYFIQNFQIHKRIENERYLQKHPELNVLLRDFMRQTCLQKPDDIRQFAAGQLALSSTLFPTPLLLSGYFTHPTLEQRIDKLIHDQMESNNADIKVISEEIYQR